jgi:hypothetical protein
VNRKLKKLNLKQEYLLLEEEDVRLELEQYVEDFESRFDKYYNSPKMGQSDDSEKYVWVNEETGEVIDELPPDEPPTEDSKKSKKDRLKSKSKKVDSVKMKKLFKKLATILHPDRGGSDEDFYKINEAYDEGDLVTLLKYAKEYGIEYEFDTSDSEIFEENLSKIELEINRMKGTLAWVWGTGDPKTRMGVIRIVETQTGHKVNEDDLPDDLRSKRKDVKLLK